MATEEFSEAGEAPMAGVVAIHAIFAAIVTGFLLHERVRIGLDLLAKFGMIPQIRLQRGMVAHEFLVIDQRRILAKLLGGFAMAIQELIEARELLAVDIAAAIVLTAIVTSFLVHEGVRILL